MIDPIQTCLNLNQEIKKKKLAIYTWGNVSIRKEDGCIVIKPSGIPFEDIKTILP